MLHGIVADFPGQVEVHQHGYAHENHGGPDSKHEFSTDRDFDTQRQCILRGRKLLTRAFGEHFFPAFSPPYGFTQARMIRIAWELGFPVWSGLGGAFEPGRPHLVSPDIDWHSWDPPRIRDRAEVVSDWRHRQSSDFAGFVIHPRFATAAENRTICEVLTSLVPHSQSRTFAELDQMWRSCGT
jgi:hypothetical protein